MSEDENTARRVRRRMAKAKDPGSEQWPNVQSMGVMLADNNPSLVRTAKEIACGILNIASLQGQLPGVLEIEACFGSGTGGAFMSHIPALDAQMLLTAFEKGMVEWDRVEEGWSIVYDTFLTIPSTGQSVRTRSVNGGPSENICKTRVVRMDVTSPTRADMTARLQGKVERTVEPPRSGGMLLLKSDSVRVSTRRSFEAESRTMQGLSYRFTVMQSWTGRTSCEAERQMHAGAEAQSSVEIECQLAWPQVDEHKLLFGLLSLLMKCQDIMEVLCGDRCIHRLKLQRFEDSLQVGKLKKRKKARGKKRKAAVSV